MGDSLSRIHDKGENAYGIRPFVRFVFGFFFSSLEWGTA